MIQNQHLQQVNQRQMKHREQRSLEFNEFLEGVQTAEI